jgi:hypothetical protein
MAKSPKTDRAVSTFVRADKLRLASLFQSTEETRYYLNGVFIHAAEEGVCLAATNGSTLGVFQDIAGFTFASVIVALPKEAKAAIKSRKEPEFCWFGVIGGHQGAGRREARVYDTVLGGCTPDEAQVALLDATDHGVIWSGAVDLIDGIFPEYSAVIPPRRAKQALGAFVGPTVIKPFLEVAAGNGLQLYPAGPSQPIIVDCGRSDFIGVIMPRDNSPTVVDAADHIEPPAWAMRRDRDLVRQSEKQDA